MLSQPASVMCPQGAERSVPAHVAAPHLLQARVIMCEDSSEM